MKERSKAVLMLSFAGLFVLGISTWVSAQNLERISAEFQFTPGLPGPEIQTTLIPTPAGTGGKVVYSKSVFVPHDGTLFVTFAGAGDTHAGGVPVAGAALLMTCLVDGAVCQSGSGLGTAGPSGWVTLQKMPQPTAVTNCGDGGGGSGDCHDNNINYSWCSPIDKGPHTVALKLASSNGGIVFYERAHIYIDNTKDKKKNDLCVPAAVVPGSTTTP